MKEDNSKFNTTIPSTVPKQKLATSQKGPEWCKDNLLYWEQRLVNRNTLLESSKINMKRNSNLYYHNILDPLDIAKVCNPMGIKDFTIPKDFKHYKIENPKIQTLKGEELKRKFEWKVYVSNRDAISKKEEQKKDEYFQFIVEKIKAEALSQEQLDGEFKKLNDYLAYDWQEIRERTADELLHHFNQYLDLKTEFSKAWEFGLINSEEIMCVDEFNGKPVVTARDPKTVYWQNEGGNRYIDDSDAIVDVSYLPLGQVIDYYYDELTSSQVSELESRQANLSEYRNFTYNQYYTKTETGFIIDNQTQELVLENDDFRDYYDNEGNIRIVHCRWKSLRKVGELSFFDENGDQQIKHVDENYKIDKDLGETIRWLWVTEAWENTRIGDDIFVKGKPRSVQFRKLDNISYCSLGYIGTSLQNGVFDLMKDYSIKYDAYMFRTEQAMIKALGKIAELDLSLIPDGWDLDMWMHYAVNMGWAVIDSFKEGKKGAAMGKLAGQGASRGNVINLEQGQFIQQNMLMLQYIEGQLDKLIGINPGRQGITSPDGGLQLNREAIQASSNITESYFDIHDNVKLRTLRALLEVAKYCLREKTESIQYITSEMTSKIFEVDGELINEAEYGILVGNANNDAKMIESLQEAVKIALQTGAVDLIQLMDVFSNENTSTIKRKIEKSVKEKQQREAQQAEQQNQLEQQRLQQEAKQHQELLNDKQADRDLEQYKIDKGFEEAIQAEEIRVFAKQKELDLNHNGIPDPMEIADKALQQQEIDSNRFTEQSKILQKQVEIKDNKDLASRKLDIEEQKLKIELKNQKNDLDIAKLNAKNRSKK
jgi:hypothetical protein